MLPTLTKWDQQVRIAWQEGFIEMDNHWVFAGRSYENLELAREAARIAALTVEI